MRPYQIIKRRIYLGHGISVDFRIFNGPIRRLRFVIPPTSTYPARIRHNDVGRFFFSYHRFTVKDAKKLTITIGVVRRAACTRQRRLSRRRFPQMLPFFFFVLLLLFSGSSLTRAPPGSLIRHQVKEQTGQLAASVASEMEEKNINKQTRKTTGRYGLRRVFLLYRRVPRGGGRKLRVFGGAK